MAEAKWIKICTDIFEDEKIMLIESMDDSDTVILIWFRLLCLAGKQNNSGVFMVGDGMPYTEKMLAAVLRTDEETVARAIGIFESFGMVKKVNGAVTIPNWGKHQSLDQLEKKKEYMREYMREYREKQQNLTCKANSKANVRRADKIRKDKIRKDKNRDTGEADVFDCTGYGEYENVILSDGELNKLKKEFPIDWAERIERLSRYMKSSGREYNNHYATIKSWAENDKKQKAENNDESKWCSSDEPSPEEVLGIK